MRRLAAVLLLAMLALSQAPTYAQAPVRSPAELEALLAPIALYPDALLSDVLVAATYPDDVYAAADWLRANPQLQGESAVRAADALPWHPALKRLLANRELVLTMAQSPQWTEDLGQAYLAQAPAVMASVASLRQRAAASEEPAPLAAPVYGTVIQSSVVYFPSDYPRRVTSGHWHGQRHAIERPRPVSIFNHVDQAHARPIVQGAPIQPRISYVRPRGRLLDFPAPKGKPDDHRDAGRRHAGGARRDASHAGGAH